ncbi:PREDICTED: cell cycle checkpoint protein RAD1 [Rhagoletis zephyria]|uniref:cell cycle checkpoint protein RAD1 n=1 Tax=Rhagoletis zephyria TaxID=28612 RepID=UPI0008117E05|nr:PREDICTED: cell cycle checkpoint protein RAD1 [Rhagoletis zephyria]XP_036345636.1 cell cycle checkpoint protein RAD1-like [Rhagoletis pomonella]
MQHSKTLYEKGILKNIRMLTQRQYSNFKFVARLDQIKTFYTGIKSLNFENNGKFQISEDGVRVTVEEGQCVQANLYMTASCFAEFHVVDMVTFGINMNIISECLGLFAGVPCSLKMFYKGHGAPLVLVLRPNDEADISAECSIKTTNVDDVIDYNLDENSSSLNVVFVRGPSLAHLFQELNKAADELRITLSPRQPHFKIETLGVVKTETFVEVAKTSDMMMLFNCRETTSACYRNTEIRLTHKALAAATKVAIKTDSSGLLEMHFMMQSEEQAEVYVQFYIMPLADV